MAKKEIIIGKVELKEQKNENVDETNEHKESGNDVQKKTKIKKQTFRRYFYGVGKEFERITWTSKRSLFSSFIVVVVILTFFSIIFTLITLGITVLI